MDFCFNYFFLEQNLLGIPSVPNSLDPGQARHVVRPDLDPNCLQSYQQRTKVAISKERVKGLLYFTSCPVKVWLGKLTALDMTLSG